LADDRSDIDNPATTCLNHVLRHKLRRIKNAIQIHVHDLLPHIFGHLEEGFVARNTGVVRQNGNMSKFLNHLFNDPAHLVGVGDIRFVCAALHALAVGCLYQLRRCFGGVMISKGDICAGIGERLDNCMANSPAAAGN
jgi:hypothetical protein